MYHYEDHNYGKIWSQVNKGVVPISAPHPIDLEWAIVRQETLDSALFQYWMNELKQRAGYHRKAWETYLILQALWQHGCFGVGKEGLGFGVGREPLPAYFASKGCTVLATDMPVSDEARRKWKDTGQHSLGDIEKFNQHGLCSKDLLISRVEYRAVDMNYVPEDLKNFDFVWSAGSLDHVGSIMEAFNFIITSLRCLRPGGIAVHTTEYSLLPGNIKASKGDTVFFRKEDVETLYDTLKKLGYVLPPLNLSRGKKPLDSQHDKPPYTSEPHLSLESCDLINTSIVFVVQAP